MLFKLACLYQLTLLRTALFETEVLTGICSNLYAPSKLWRKKNRMASNGHPFSYHTYFSDITSDVKNGRSEQISLSQ